MPDKSHAATTAFPKIVKAIGEEPIFHSGDHIKISTRFPIGHFRVPNYIRGKRGIVVAIIEPRALNNEEEGSAGMLEISATTTASPFH
jgi:nitrile hydratase